MEGGKEKMEKEIPEEILQGIKNHIAVEYEGDNSILIVDTEGEEHEKQVYMEIGRKLADIVVGTYNITENQEVVDIVGKEYPFKRVFLLTNYEHLIKHYLYKVKSRFGLNAEIIEEYEKKFPYYNIIETLYINHDLPYVVGVYTESYSLEEETLKRISDTIGESLMSMKGLSIDEKRDIGGIKNYAFFKKQYFIYEGKATVKYLLRDMSDYKDDALKDEFIIDIKQVWFVEGSTDLLNELLDP